MDLSFLDKSSNVTPLLVKLYEGKKLGHLAKDKKPLARAELTSAVIELMEMKVNPRESELIADVLIELMNQAEKDLRQALAERLSILDNVPLRLILQISNDEIEVADPVLRNSTVLSDLDLIYIIKAKGPEYWRSIAKRKSLSGQVINILSDTKDLGTNENLVMNSEIELTHHTIKNMAELALEHDIIAKPLLHRPEISKDIVAAIYEGVGESLKRYISENFGIGNAMDDEISDHVEDVVLEFSNIKTKSRTDKTDDTAQSDEDLSEFEPTGLMKDTAERYARKGLLNVRLMVDTFRRGQFQSFVAQLSVFAGLDTKSVLQVLQQESGKQLAIIARATDIIKPDFVSIFLLTAQMRSESKVVGMKEMSQAVNYFNKIDPEAAKKILQNSFKKK